MTSPPKVAATLMEDMMCIHGVGPAGFRAALAERPVVLTARSTASQTTHTPKAPAPRGLLLSCSRSRHSSSLRQRRSRHVLLVTPPAPLYAPSRIAEESTASAYVRSDMAIKVIVELRAKPGMRDELREILVSHVPDDPVPGYLGSTRYEALDDPDLLVEIAEWESPEVRLASMKAMADSPAYTRLPELLAAPFKATVIRELP